MLATESRHPEAFSESKVDRETTNTKMSGRKIAVAVHNGTQFV